MKKIRKRQQPKSARVRQSKIKTDTVLRKGSPRFRFGTVKFGKDGCGY